MALEDVSSLVISEKDHIVWIKLDVNDPDEARSWMFRYLYSALAPSVGAESYYPERDDCENAEFFVRCYYYATEPKFRAMAKTGNYSGSQKFFVHTMNNTCILAALAVGDRVLDVTMETRT